MFETAINVRGYELDSYGHVNHSVYLNYYEQARWELIRKAGLFDQLEKAGQKLVVVKAEVRYVRELRLFDELIVQTRVKKESPYLVFYHKLINRDRNIQYSRAIIKIIMLDERKTPLDIPDQMMSSLTKTSDGQA
jgi:acyl-CoA thioester hydrolase